MSSGPRKFSEKIALLNQKQAEQNAAFISIISEVKSIRPNEIVNPPSNSLMNSNYINSQNFQDQNVSNSYLQLPSQSDSFRRAHSDSSLHQSSIGNANLNSNNNQMFHNQVKMTQDDNNYCGMFDQHNSQLNNNQTQFIHGFNLNNYQDNHHSLPFNYGNYQNLTHNMQNPMELSHKTSNSLMPQSPLNASQNTFASLPDLSSFNYNQAEITIEDNSLMSNNSNQHNLIGALKPTHYSTSPTRITTRYNPTHSNRRLSPQRSDKYQSQIQNLNLRNNNYGVTNNSIAPSNIYRNNNTNESLPPSPKSQNYSPQGSPGPHSISQQDINPFSCNNYETMQKKFDLFNLDATHSPYNSYNSPQKIGNMSKNMMNGSNNNSQNSNLQNNINTNENSNSDNNHSKNNLLTHGSNHENFNFGKQHLNSKQLMQHSNNNRINDLIDNTDIRSNYNLSNCENSNISMNSTSIFCGNSINNNGPPHKNSIPDIILTFSDSSEDKGDFVKVLSGDLYNDCNKADDSLDFEHLQIFGDSPETHDGLTLDQQILQYRDNNT